MRKAFTLVELLIVIAILAVLAVVVFVVINPAQRITDAQNAQVRSDVQNIQKAFELYATDHGGAYPNVDANQGGGPIPATSQIPGDTLCTQGQSGTNYATTYQNRFDMAGTDTIYPTYLPIVLASPFGEEINHNPYPTNAYRIFIYSPTNQVIVCGYLADGSPYFYPSI